MSEKKETKKKSKEEPKANPDFEITDEQILQFSKSANSAKARKDEPQAEYAQLFRTFQEDGGHNKAMKDTLKLQAMEEEAKRIYIRNLVRYCTVLDVFDFNEEDIFGNVIQQVAAAAATDKTPSGATVN